MLDATWESESFGSVVTPVVEPISLAADDGHTLGATLTRAVSDRPVVGVVVVAGAMAVRASRYAKLARSFARSGFHVLTFDYRGVGDSLAGRVRSSRATLHEWGELDLAAVLAHADARFPELPLFFLGHSVGGQLFGLVKPGRVRAAALFASQSGYFGHWSGAGRAAMAALWTVIPGLARTWGYLPMRALGQGDDVPAGVALEWASWGRDPRYIMKFADERRGAHAHAFRSYRGRLRLFSFADDVYAPRRAVEALAEAYSGASKVHVHLEPRDIHKRAIGHFAILREAYEDTLWAAAKTTFLDSLAE